jgi:hypothetical protein
MTIEELEAMLTGIEPSVMINHKGKEIVVHAAIAEDGSRAIVICLDEIAVSSPDARNIVSIEPLFTWGRS